MSKTPTPVAVKAQVSPSANDDRTVVSMPVTEVVRPKPKNPAMEHTLEVVEGTGPTIWTDQGMVQGSAPPREPEVVQAEQNGFGMEVVRS